MGLRVKIAVDGVLKLFKGADDVVLVAPSEEVCLPCGLMGGEISTWAFELKEEAVKACGGEGEEEVGEAGACAHLLEACGFACVSLSSVGGMVEEGRELWVSVAKPVQAPYLEFVLGVCGPASGGGGEVFAELVEVHVVDL